MLSSPRPSGHCPSLSVGLAGRYNRGGHSLSPLVLWLQRCVQRYLFVCVHIMVPAVAATTSVDDNIYQRMFQFFCFPSASAVRQRFYTLVAQSVNVTCPGLIPRHTFWSSGISGIVALVF